MLPVAVLAIVLTAGADVPLPLSPANLPPPPVPAAPVRSPNGAGVGFHFHSCWLKAPIDGCRMRALTSVAAVEGFRFAEITCEGHVAGYTDSTRFMVVIDTGSEGTTFDIAAVSRGSNDTIAVASGIMTRILSSSLVSPADERTRAGAPDPVLDSVLPALAWHVGTHEPVDQDAYLGPVIKLQMSKLGFDVRPASDLGVGGLWMRRLSTAMAKYRERLHRPRFGIEGAPLAAVRPQLMKQVDESRALGIRIGKGPRNEVKLFSFLTGNTLDAARAGEELKRLTATVNKIVYE